MKSVLGFGRENEEVNEVRKEERTASHNLPVSLARVRFPDRNCCYTYFNDRFDLREGDLVFVTGKMAGVSGIVDSVNYRFKIRLEDYEQVIAHPEVRLAGTYVPVLDKMVSCDGEAVSPETFRSWVMAPAPEEDGETPGFVTGEGYSFELEHFTDDDDVESEVLNRAVDYCRDGRVRYLSVRDGIGTAFVEGTEWYEVNFRFENGSVSDMYCECPYPGLCKHNLAVLITLRELGKKLEADGFTAVDKGFFYRMLNISGQSITV